MTGMTLGVAIGLVAAALVLPRRIRPVAPVVAEPATVDELTDAEVAELTGVLGTALRVVRTHV